MSKENELIDQWLAATGGLSITSQALQHPLVEEIWALQNRQKVIFTLVSRLSNRHAERLLHDLVGTYPFKISKEMTFRELCEAWKFWHKENAND